MKSLMNLKSVMVALMVAACSMIAVSCNKDDDDVDPGEVMAGEYVGTLYVQVDSQDTVYTYQNVTLSFVNMGHCMVKAKTPAIQVSIVNPNMTMTMDFGSFEVDSIPVNGIKGIAMTGTSLGEVLDYKFVDSEVDYERNGQTGHTTVEGSISAAVTDEDIIAGYTFVPGSMKRAGLSITASFAGSKK